ncbi:MAG: type II 3-dehydroquinate dehydratase [Pseudomonadales bacterium]|nr:type II 3-dehydroquinate dehydratase [Pseudomonadales bacterium]
MQKVAVVQGAGMDVRGKVQVEIFGPDTLDEINARIAQDAAAVDLAVEVFQSNDEAATVAWIQGLNAEEYVAAIINPSGFTATEGPLAQTIAESDIPFYEVHASNPSARDVRSKILPVCVGGVCGFGYAGYGIALRSIRLSLDV